MRRSILQKKILINIAEQSKPEKSIATLAKCIGKSRPSVSRSLALLRKQGLIYGMQITDAGMREVETFFRPATDIIWDWGDLTMCFRCSCGDEIVLSNEDNLKQCECGREYRFTYSIETRGISKFEDEN